MSGGGRYVVMVRRIGAEEYREEERHALSIDASVAVDWWRDGGCDAYYEDSRHASNPTHPDP